jgi:hypothetical protein
MDSATGGQCLPTQMARGANQSGTQDRPGIGYTPGERRGRTPREILWHSGVSVFAAEPGLPSGDSPGDVVEPSATPACVALPYHHESRRAPCENAADKSPLHALRTQAPQDCTAFGTKRVWYSPVVIRCAISQIRCPMSIWASWIRGTDVDGIQMAISAISASSSPLPKEGYCASPKLSSSMEGLDHVR